MDVLILILLEGTLLVDFSKIQEPTDLVCLNPSGVAFDFYWKVLCWTRPKYYSAAHNLGLNPYSIGRYFAGQAGRYSQRRRRHPES